MSAAGLGAFGELFGSAVQGLRSGLEDKRKYEQEDAAGALAQTREQRLRAAMEFDQNMRRQEIEYPWVNNMGGGVIGVMDKRTRQPTWHQAPESPETVRKREYEEGQRKLTKEAWDIFKADSTVPPGLKNAARILEPKNRDMIISEWYRKEHGLWKPSAASQGVQDQKVAAELRRMGYSPTDPAVLQNPELMGMAQEGADKRALDERLARESAILQRGFLLPQIQAGVAGERDAHKDTVEGMQSLRVASGMVSSMGEMLEKLVPKGVGGRVLATTTDPISMYLQAGERGKSLAMFESLKIDLSNVIRTLGERGVLTQQDRSFVEARLPKPQDRYEVAMGKINQIMERLRASEAAWATRRFGGYNRMGSTVESAGGRVVLPQPEMPQVVPPKDTTPTPSKGFKVIRP